MVVVHGKRDARAVLVALDPAAVINAPANCMKPLDGGASGGEGVVSCADLGGDLRGAQLAVGCEPIGRVVLGAGNHRGEGSGEELLDERVALCLATDALSVDAPSFGPRRLRGGGGGTGRGLTYEL